ncbi:hypothetical protein IQ06DRAFT_334878 [Phaeosphaeriaceae sp. SRC1lsM3a]|nr:hypothetical protein IQ06DRAFT_334878 [Stagonospora sp. SRC1lsM3a]
MRFLTLVLSGLGLANLTMGGVVHSKSASSSQPSLSSQHAAPPGFSLSRWHPSETAPMPTRSFHIDAVFKREEPSRTVVSPSCSPGYFYGPTTSYSYASCNSAGADCSQLATFPTSTCIQTMCSSGSTPYLPIWTDSSCTEVATKPKEPVTTVCTDKATTGSITCWYTSPNWGGTRSQHHVAQFATRATQDLGGKYQRWVADFAEPAVTAKPDANQAAAVDPVHSTCSFDLRKGRYICPKTSRLPICSFNLVKSEYLCLKTPNVGVPTVTTKPGVNQAEAKKPPSPTCSFDLSKGQYVCRKRPTTLKTVTK